MYDYLIVGSGLYGSTFAYRAKRLGKRSLVIDKRLHLGGDMEPYYTVNDERNIIIADQYRELVAQEKNAIFGGH